MVFLSRNLQRSCLANVAHHASYTTRPTGPGNTRACLVPRMWPRRLFGAASSVPAVWPSPTIGERWPPFGERWPAFGERLPLFGERMPLSGERNPLISGILAKTSTVRERKRSNPRPEGNQWRAKSAGFRPECHIFKTLHEWRSKRFLERPLTAVNPVAFAAAGRYSSCEGYQARRESRGPIMARECKCSP